MEYEEESIHNVLMAAQNTIVSIAKKVKDNILHVMTTLVIALQPTMLQTPVANLLHALVRAPNTLVDKWVRMPMGKLKDAKPWTEPAKAQT